jgi:hypothetical protein
VPRLNRRPRRQREQDERIRRPAHRLRRNDSDSEKLRKVATRRQLKSAISPIRM